jgi:hypothetical protein
MLLTALLAFLGAGLQFFAAYRVQTAQGALQTPQARAIEAAVGRKGTVAVFGGLGVLLTLVGVWLLLRLFVLG